MVPLGIGRRRSDDATGGGIAGGPFSSSRLMAAMTIWIPLTMLFVVEMAGAVGLFTVPVLAPAAAVDLGIDPNWVGVFTGLVFMGAMLSSTLGSHLVVRYGGIRITQVGLLTMAGTLVLLTAAVVPAFAVGGVTLGMSYGLLNPSASQILARHSPPKVIALVFSIKQTGNPLGGILAGATVPVLVLAFDWRAASFAVALLCLVWAVAIQGLRRPLDDDARSAHPISLRKWFEPWQFVLRNPRLRALSLAQGPYAAMQTCLTSYFVVYVVADLGFDLVTAGLAVSVAQAAGMVGRLTWGAIAGPLIDGRRLFGILGVVMSLTAASLAAVSPDWPLSAILLVSALFGAAGLGWGGVFMAELARRAPPGEVARAAGGSSSIGFFGGVLGPLVFSGLVAATGSYGMGFLLLSVVTLIPSLVLARAPVER